MKILSCSSEEVVVEILRGRSSSWKLLLHHRDEVGVDFIDFISSKQVGDLSRGEHVVDVLQESLIFDLIVREEESDSFSLLSCYSIEHLEVIQEVVGIVGARQLDLEGLVSSNVGGQASETLLARATNSYKKSGSSVRADDARYLDEVDHGIFEEDKIHASTANGLIVLHQKVAETFLHLRIGWNL